MMVFFNHVLKTFTVIVLSRVIFVKSIDNRCPLRKHSEVTITKGNITSGLLGELHNIVGLHSCSGFNNTREQLIEDIQEGLINMTGKEAINIIRTFQRDQANCSTFIAGGKFPLLPILYESTQFYEQAAIAIRTANMMSALLTKGACSDIQYSNSSNPTNSTGLLSFLSDKLLYDIARSNVESDQQLHGSGIVILPGGYSRTTQGRFAPYAYREVNHGSLIVSDLGVDWNVLHEKLFSYINGISKNRSYNCETSVLYKSHGNNTRKRVPQLVTHPVMEYIDGMWSRPYFECATARGWLVNFAVPFFKVNYNAKNGSLPKNGLEFMGVATVDVEVGKIDINQCDLNSSDKFNFEIFAGTHHCKQPTTQCVPIHGRGFVSGSYQCICKDGFYFPQNVEKELRYFNGSLLEEQIRHPGSSYNMEINSYQCLPCSPGCQTCIDGSPCLFEYHWTYRIILLSLIIVCILLTIILAAFVWYHRDVRVMKAASPKFLIIALFGAVLMFCEGLLLYSEETRFTCQLRPWFKYIGFGLLFGAMFLKTWRISMIFTVKSARRIRITDRDLYQRLSPIVMIYAAYLTAMTLSRPHRIYPEKTFDGVRFSYCLVNWWDHAIDIGSILFMFWGIYLSYVIRKAPSFFNEGKYIGWSIYNMTAVTILTKLLRVFFIVKTGPDISFLLEFLRLQLTVTALVIMVFLPKILKVLKGSGNLSGTGSRTNHAMSTNGSEMQAGTERISKENDTLKAEIRKLYSEIEVMKLSSIEAGNRHLGHSPNTLTSPNATLQSRLGNTLDGSTLSLGNTMKSNQYFSPTADLMSDFV